ncbi:hypothetical protein J7F03_26600 [Streptomyces sp. ISL-43]|uniref:hypothetical protein n=1 Tax=Streptomyces sp. ISL-43 TaxID=2819183 RepID=UPI001BE5F8DF|nr:hypothetical protein [Streptomyces sp. ISL-43]MBT2450582.1 hypothetical protein [Streptomyces sp. ISL-43]
MTVKRPGSAVDARHLAPCVAVLLASLLCGGCGSGARPSPAAAPDPAATPAATPAPLDPLATALGCTPEVTVDAQEVREGACEVGAQAFRLATFATAEGRAAWLAESRQYGGAYLVGDRWIVTGPSPADLTPLQATLGGTLDSPPSHGSHGSHPPGHSP